MPDLVKLLPIIEERSQGRSVPDGVVVLDGDTVIPVADDVGDTTGAIRDDRTTARHRFEQDVRDPPPDIERADHHDLRVGIEDLDVIP